MTPALVKAFTVLDWFVPASAKRERSELGLARNFVFTHLLGPALGQSMSVYLYFADPVSSPEKWTLIGLITLFWTLPFLLRWTGSLPVAAWTSFQLLTFASLFGAYFYGGVSSPFMPWLVVALLLGFFYLSDRALWVIGVFFVNLAGFGAAYFVWGHESRLPMSQLEPVGWASILSATIYMAWMALYYSSIVSSRSETEREADRHRATAARLREAKEFAERASTSKSIFLAKMSHALRTPLNAVIGYSEMLLEDAEIEGKNKQTLQDLGRIRSAGKHLLSLVDDVLDLSKIESSTMEIAATRFELRTFVNDVVSNAVPLMAKKDNKFEVVAKGDLGHVVTDATKLRQAVLNLLSNAAKFTERGVITLILVRDVKVGGDWIEVTVKDTGIGIADADRSKLFQNFGQVAASTGSKYGGTGLGLSLSQKLCALMGGSITCESEPNRGSAFTIRIPADITAFATPANEGRAGLASIPELALPLFAR